MQSQSWTSSQKTTVMNWTRKNQWFLELVPWTQEQHQMRRAAAPETEREIGRVLSKGGKTDKQRLSENEDGSKVPPNMELVFHPLRPL